MEVNITNRNIVIIGDNVVGFEGDNLTSNIVATTDKPKEWHYKLEVESTVTGQRDIIDTVRIDNIIFVNFTREMLPSGGRYIGQFRAIEGQREERTDTFEFYVKNSIQFTDCLRKIPQEFFQLEKRMEELLKQVEEETFENKNIYDEIQAIYEDIKNIQADFGIALEEHNTNPKAHENIEIDSGIV